VHPEGEVIEGDLVIGINLPGDPQAEDILHRLIGGRDHEFPE